MHDDLPPLAAFFDAIDATWAPLRLLRAEGWTIREGGGGGKRVSAATRIKPGAGIAAAESAMRALGQAPLFMLRPGEEDLDAALAARGYTVVDPVTLFAAPAGQVLAAGTPGYKAVIGDHLMPVMAEIWAAGGIGPARLAVMERVPAPKAYLLSRTDDTPGGVAFVAASRGIAMIHAIEVLPELRRRGLGRLLLLGAAAWAREAGATVLALAVTDANRSAISLYRGLGMAPVARYHYRQAPAEGASDG